MKAVTVQQNEAHVTSWQDRMLNQAAFGEDSYVLNIGQKMVAETYSNNEIRIRDGALVHQGCLSVIQKGTYDAVTIQNGTQGMKRVDLIVARYTKNAETQIENVNWVVIQGTPAASNPSVPSYIEGDIQNGDLTVDMPMYQVHLNGINIENVTAVYTSVQTMLDMQADISSLNSNFVSGNLGSFRITHQLVSLTYASATELAGFMYCGADVAAATATIIYQNSTPIDQVDRLYIDIGPYNTPSRINIHAHGTGFISGHILKVAVIVITTPA